MNLNELLFTIIRSNDDCGAQYYEYDQDLALESSKKASVPKT